MLTNILVYFEQEDVYIEMYLDYASKAKARTTRGIQQELKLFLCFPHLCIRNY